MAVAYPTIPIPDLDDVSTVLTDDFLVVNQSDGTRKAKINDVLNDISIAKIVYFNEGGHLDSKKDLAYDIETNRYYTWNGEYPKVILPDSTLEGAGGVRAGAWAVFGELPVTASGGIIDYGAIGGTLELDLKVADTFVVRLTTDTTLILGNETEGVEGTARSVTIVVTQTTGGSKIYWPDNIRWAFGRKPILTFTQGATDIFKLETYDNGLTWYGSLIIAGAM